MRSNAAPTLQPESAASAGPLILQPLAVGRLGLPNRIVFGAHLTNFGKGNAFTDRHLAYYRERAAGGAGLVITEALTVHPLDWPYEHVPFGHRDAIVPNLSALRANLRSANPDTRMVAQLNHTGGQCSGRLLRQSPWAASPMTDVASKRMARQMVREEIVQVIDGFSAAAARVHRAGLDGVELNAGQWSLIRQFLSPLTNQRQDEYGGDADRRQRFLLEIVARVRQALGPEATLGIKLCGDELAPWGGLTPQDASVIALRLASTGAVDYLSIEIGGPYSTHVTDAAMPTPQGHAAHLAGTVRTALRDSGNHLSVFAEGRIESELTASQILESQLADAVVMTRALISDARLPRKVALAHGIAVGPGGEPDDAEPTRPHVGHTRYYSVRGDWNRPLSDLANPRAGREAILPRPGLLPESQGDPVLVIGAGPAGCEAALTLARQGARVTLVEARSRLGGWADRLAATVPARTEYGPLVAYYAAMLAHTGVQVLTGVTVQGREAKLAGRPLSDFVRIYVAVGAEAPPLELHVESPKPPLLTARHLLDGTSVPAGGRAAVIDTEYGFRMANAVEFLLVRGYSVEVVSPDFFVGRELVESGDFLWFQRVAAAQANGRPAAIFHPRLRTKLLRDDTLVCVDRFSEEEVSIGPLDLVVLAQPEIPATALYELLAARHPSVVRIGDARAPRQMGEAILNAHRAVVLGSAH